MTPVLFLNKMKICPSAISRKTLNLNLQPEENPRRVGQNLKKGENQTLLNSLLCSSLIFIHESEVFYLELQGFVQL